MGTYCRKLALGTAEKPKYVVVLSYCGGKKLLSRHRARTTWETQGGHIEPGETPLQAAKRELYEESGAAEHAIVPLFDYEAGDDNGSATGVVFRAEVTRLGSIPESEMEEVRVFDA
ncbi:MAG: NUDIX domain-containing protein [Ruminococcus sp.]|nr:NUDIX domain-containing protein [Ruminococcus sp.]